MAGTSISQQTKDVTAQVSTILASQDIDNLSSAEREVLATIKSRVIDVRLEVRDYEYAETRAEQLTHAKAAIKRLKHLQKDILKLSEYGLFSAVDVAQLTAQTEHIIEQLA